MLSSIKEYQPKPQIPQNVWMTLGFPSCGTMLHDLVRAVLPFEYLERIASFSAGAARGYLQTYLHVSHNECSQGESKTVQQRRKQPPGCICNSLDEAISLFENNQTAATERMTSPVRGLGSKHPIDQLRTRVETKAVFDLIASWRGAFLFEIDRADSLIGSTTLATSDNPDIHE